MGKVIGWAVVVVSVLGGALLLYGATQADSPEGRQRGIEREAIAQCREKQGDELQELATRRLIRQACDQMEADYRAKWNRAP